MSEDMKTTGNKVLDELLLIVASADMVVFPTASSTTPVKVKELSVKQTRGFVKSKLDAIKD